VPLLSSVSEPAFVAGTAVLAALAWWMRRITDAVRFAWAGILMQTLFVLSCAFLTRPGHGSFALVLPIFIATPLVTAPLWARRQTVIIATALAYLAGAYALVHAHAGVTVWWAYAIQAAVGAGVALMMHATVDQARRGNFRAEEDLAERARIDSLTSLLNRRHFLELGERVIQRQAKRGEALTAFFLDLDHFKQVNDEFGHRTGDSLLVAIAQCMLPLVNDMRVIGRLGGEEFTLLLRGVDGQAAEELAERLRRDIAALVIAEARVTASVGIAEWQPGETLSDLLHRADLALLEAKRLGRDCIVHWSAALAAKPVPRRMARPAALPTHEPVDGSPLRPLS
jgi:diguanylate cyclase (GGDEF)-like protein